MIFHENRLLADDSHELADDSHEISYFFCYFRKSGKILKLSSAANYRWRFMG